MRFDTDDVHNILLIVLILVVGAGFAALMGRPYQEIADLGTRAVAPYAGNAAHGITSTGNAYLQGGIDVGGFARTILVNTDGSPYAVISGTAAMTDTAGSLTVDIDTRHLAGIAADRLKVIEHDRSIVLDGNLYSIQHPADLITSAARVFAIRPANTKVHAAIGFIGGGQLSISMWETPTISGGQAVVPINFDRTSTNLATAVFTHAPTVTVYGTAVFTNAIVPGGTGVALVGGSGKIQPEFILQEGVTYLLGVQNVSGGTISTTIDIGFYEE